MNKRSRKQSPREVVPQQTVRVGDVAFDVGSEFRELLIKGGLAIAAALFNASWFACAGRAMRAGSSRAGGGTRKAGSSSAAGR
ncbi:MAG: hypothetical protein HYZ28_28780 [Myxococcales bacterium]|nr:hypothetical protein [Myxococcales bacterium]